MQVFNVMIFSCVTEKGFELAVLVLSHFLLLLWVYVLVFAVSFAFLLLLVSCCIPLRPPFPYSKVIRNDESHCGM